MILVTKHHDSGKKKVLQGSHNPCGIFRDRGGKEADRREESRNVDEGGGGEFTLYNRERVPFCLELEEVYMRRGRKRGRRSVRKKPGKHLRGTLVILDKESSRTQHWKCATGLRSTRQMTLTDSRTET